MWECALDVWRDHARITAVSVNATPMSLDLNRMQGVYQHDAYGTIEVCLRPDSVPHLDITSSATCVDLLYELPFAVKNPSQPEFIIRSSSPWADYLRLTHLGGDVFKLEFIGCWKETGLVTVETLGSWYKSNVVRFVKGEVWFGGNYWGAEIERMAELGGDSTREDADVIFRKVI